MRILLFMNLLFAYLSFRFPSCPVTVAYGAATLPQVRTAAKRRVRHEKFAKAMAGQGHSVAKSVVNSYSWRTKESCNVL